MNWYWVVFSIFCFVMFYGVLKQIAEGVERFANVLALVYREEVNAAVREAELDMEEAKRTGAVR